MTKEQAILVFGGGSEGLALMAKALRITRQAIYQWPDPIPELRELQIDRICELERLRRTWKRPNAVEMAAANS